MGGEFLMKCELCSKHVQESEIEHHKDNRVCETCYMLIHTILTNQSRKEREYALERIFKKLGVLTEEEN